jgi:hypothetical protein
MNHIIHNISVIFIFFGIILLTVNLTKSYNKCPVLDRESNKVIAAKPVSKDRPSKVYSKMFNQPDVWMGYADFDTKDFKSTIF